MPRLLLGLVSIGILLCSALAYGEYADFEQTLDTLGVDAQAIAERDTLSRYEVARLLNLVECVDCLNPSAALEDRYTNPFWSDFTQLPGKDFKDISYRGGMRQGESYYYCVAYAGDKNYMRGYPASTSPICAGLFCGARNTTNAEFVQVVINILSNYVYDQYRVNRTAIKRWMDNLGATSYAARTLNSDDTQIITAAANSCNAIDCQLTSAEQFKTYLKYCMFNIQACNMQAFGQIGQAFWPVAELNIIRQQGILALNPNDGYDIYGYVDGETLLQALYKLYGVVDCRYDTDYDCDGLANHVDNCPNIYNPSQNDMDGDGIGDVCDDDVDGDGLLNPVGIVDDHGRVNIRLMTGSQDACVLSNQSGSNCGDKDAVALYLRSGPVQGSAPLRVNIQAISQGPIGTISRDMGDGTTAAGNQITHTYTLPGLYIVTARGSSGTNQTVAKTTVIVGANASDVYGLSISSDQLSDDSLPGEFRLSVESAGKIDSILRDFGDGTTVIRAGTQSITKQYSRTGIYTVSAIAQYRKQTVGVARVYLGAGAVTQGVQLTSNTVSTQTNTPVAFATQIRGFTVSDIQSITWNFGDGIQVQNTSLLMNHSYTSMGTKVVSQDIVLRNGLRYTTLLTIYIDDPALYLSYGVNLTPSQLIVQPGEVIAYDWNPLGDRLLSSIIGIQQYTNTRTQKYNTANTNLQYRYETPGVYYPSNILYINQCQYLESQATVVVDETDQCLAWYNEGSKGNFCDLDRDKIPDVCDDDIDGDGVKNLIGVVLEDNDNCSFDAQNVNSDLLDEHIAGVCSLDNCPRLDNTDQEDLNRNNIGDVCEQQVDAILAAVPSATRDDSDIDRDGIIDVLDACVEIPESYNGITDADGCPEIGSELACPVYTQARPAAGAVGLCPANTTRCSDGSCQEVCASNNAPACNNNGICDDTENCACSDCTAAANYCAAGLACATNSLGNGVCLPSPTSPAVVRPNCTDPTKCITVPPISLGQCNQCPCQYADFVNTLHDSDLVRAILLSTGRDIIYNASQAKKIEDILVK